MGTTHERITPPVRSWIERQQMFFVATAPLAADGHVNSSPKGLDTLRFLDDRRVAYLDLTGSGIETIAHLQENARITLMFCAFEGPPRIVRLQGRGQVHLPGSPGWETLIGAFGRVRGERAIIQIDCDRIGDSCGYAVPLYEYRGQRTRLTEWADQRSDGELVDYRRTKNAQSVDGLAGYGRPTDEASRPPWDHTEQPS